ncbi:TPA: hypothetical protein DEP34_00500 [Candidatus Uhrbacteria bacterium]|uniref:Uncharacterized protein n=2 Tax=Candidatus Uhriibacteriota TaxID=1752732 RepID=A0A0G1Q8T2_9BACT|nr:MAG: hypothetical protein UX45_C0003G0051 [Candidatus Uhrbacteria bacterium GW2011_GWF2_46_218]KKU41222.1 MAG: hypothetical protein UX57_C0005G0052 [Candidatus Uhrbacteria bacterium GW2011_GWE2_46_68]HBK34071.1 hypothetical protein [Candidatus Uhrbacteria bacterium]HCB18851.1 hypothetical protein [Candidatus Uhrbacteria bacterium]
MSALTQKSIEMFFEEYAITDQEKKACLLPLITPLIYNYNMDIVKLEQEQDPYKQKQLHTSLVELTKKIKEIMEEASC